MQNKDSTMLLDNVSAGKRFNNEDIVVSNDNKIGEMNGTIIVIFATYSTYL